MQERCHGGASTYDEYGSRLRKRLETSSAEGSENNIEAQNWNDEGDKMRATKGRRRERCNLQA